MSRTSKLHFRIFNFHFLKEVSHQSLILTTSSFIFFEEDVLHDSCVCTSWSGNSIAKRLRQWVFAAFFRFWRLSFSCQKSFKKGLQNRVFFGFGAEIWFWSRLWTGEASVLPTQCYRIFWLLQPHACKSHRGGCVTVALHCCSAGCTLLWSFAACCLQIALKSLRQRCTM